MNIDEHLQKEKNVEENQLRLLCNNLSMQDELEQKRSLLTFSRLDYANRCMVMKLQKSLFHQLKDKNIEVPHEVLQYCSHVIAIKQHTSNNLDELCIRAQNFKTKTRRRTNKKEKLASLFSVIKELREKENFTFRQISSYLKKYHKLKVVHSTIHSFYINNRGNQHA